MNTEDNLEQRFSPRLLDVLGRAGLIVAGILGLFVGAILLALGYQIFMYGSHPDEVRPSHEVKAPQAE